MNRRRFLFASLEATATIAFAHRALSSVSKSPGQSSLDSLVPALRTRLMHDPLRPQFHFLPRNNWMNDPCAPRFFGGEYHMFYQYNPGAAIWGDMHWGHAKSPDLIHWTHLPLALSPTPGSYDAAGCFTGSVLPGLATPTILYTGVTKTSPEQETIRGEGLREVQCLATSDDPELLVWKKQQQPILNEPPPGLKVTGFRDPCPWKEGDTWYLIVGSGLDKVGGAVLLYQSSDGRNWTYLHPLAQGQWNHGTKTNPVDTGEMWECPDFFPLGGKHVLLYSTERKVYWQVGEFDKRALKFHAETSGLLDHGSYYAMKSMVDAQGRRILWGWVPESRSPQECVVAGWAGSMALPRVLSLSADHHLQMEVAPELSTLCRQTGRLAASDRADKNATLDRMPIPHRAGRITLQFDTATGACGLELQSSGANSTPLMTISYDGSARTPSLSMGEQRIPLAPDHEGISTLDLWFDGSVIEIFVDRRQAVTKHCYEGRAGEIHPLPVERR
jgi:beta-fructofuranosidase